MSLCMTNGASAADAIIITTDDSAVTFEGDSWKLSTSDKVLGPKGGNSWYTSKKEYFKWMGSPETTGAPVENYSPVRKTLAETNLKNGKDLGLEEKWNIYNK